MDILIEKIFKEFFVSYSSIINDKCQVMQSMLKLIAGEKLNLMKHFTVKCHSKQFLLHEVSEMKKRNKLKSYDHKKQNK